ncbi:hypothetical protein [Stackebrandtia nassauensis]|uniref:Uncharacterized protein n=1 Tax=Stackebrandtia nassauensis (strain DSM 44728 / CIP 108903 / NRRL B-16338 / NBRC 102104 / LLR-40K-21) TaxID=446470 RepID=D3Q2G7_STANL|nr:hypothetical protein [Stackebrandtia nassauensis]ADD43900.1 hypothetical protein Snas_4251 [Stackebrandtia nassauensis DSM 44728]
MTKTDESFRILNHEIEVAEIMAAAAAFTVHRRSQIVVAKSRPEQEAEQLPAIARYTDHAHQTILAARTAIRDRYSPTSTVRLTTPQLPENTFHSGTPRRRQVTRALTVTLNRLWDIVGFVYDVINQPQVPRTDELADLVYFHTFAACGQWSIAHRAYQRATRRRRPRLNSEEFDLQTAGIAFALKGRIPDPVWQGFAEVMDGGEYCLILEDIVGVLIDNKLPVTIVEYDTLVSLLHYIELPNYRPALAERLTVSPIHDIL